MSELTLNGALYRTGKLDLRTQLHVSRRLATTPLAFMLGSENNPSALPKEVADRARESGFNPEELATTIPRMMPLLSIRALGELPQADVDYITNSCLAVCLRQSGVPGTNMWARVLDPAGVIMFADLDMRSMLELVMMTLRENIGSFFDASLLPSPGPKSMDQPLTG